MTKPKTHVQDESNFSPGEINQMEGKGLRSKKKKKREREYYFKHVMFTSKISRLNTMRN